MTGMGVFNKLPLELVEAIFLRVTLPATLQRLEDTCRAVKNLIKSPEFLAAWLCHAYGPQEAMYQVGPCMEWKWRCMECRGNRTVW